jgi:hypothetical protein
MLPNHHVSIFHIAVHKVSLMKLGQPFPPLTTFTFKQSVSIEGPVFPVSSLHDDHFPSGTNVFETPQLRSDIHFRIFLVHYQIAHELDIVPLPILNHE